MDYDLTNIPNGYDRGRDHGPEVLHLWMNIIGSYLEDRVVTRILDLGCGTGRFTVPLAVRFEAEVLGIDPSKKMLDRAREKRHVAGVQYQLGSAEAIPLADRSVDMVFMSMSFHHFKDPSLAARECRRVLHDNGIVVIRTGTREQIPSYPYVPFFPSTRSMLEDLLQDGAGLRKVFEAAGFRFVASEIVTQTIAPSWGAYAERLSAGGDSVLARLGQEELKSGLTAMRNHVVRGARKVVVEPIDLLVFRTCGPGDAAA